ncbi:hypothetical protein [Maribacter polysaccharolyticus]|nr:hypothetical protein [Maribacter polysaccharolyticus]MDE3743098.1 hypothetical protein [Maribacter polysaccharolyticus]
MLNLAALGIDASGITDEERDKTVTGLLRTQEYSSHTLEGLREPH